jgi:hypothetical protein
VVPVPSATINLLKIDPDLAEHCPPHQLFEATRRVVTDFRPLRRGSWDPLGLGRDAFAAYVVSRSLVRTLRLGPRYAAEVVGPSDIFRLRDNPVLTDELALHAEFEVIEAAQIAVLDARVRMLFPRYRWLDEAIHDRIERRATALNYQKAANGNEKVRCRALAALWYTGTMWGTRTRIGTVLPYHHLTHQHLADIVGASRPTVTEALGKLFDEGFLTYDAEGRFVLLGDAPDWDRIAPRRAAPPA